MESQVVPIAEPDWNYHKEKGIWEQTHFINCIIEVLKRAQTKPLNYAKLADAEQREGSFWQIPRETVGRPSKVH